MITGRLTAQPERIVNQGGAIELQDPDKTTYTFAGHVFNVAVDGRKVTLTAKEIADALGAK